MFIISLDKFRLDLRQSRAAIAQLAASKGRVPKVYLHWSAARYDQYWDDYHINIAGDGQLHTDTEDFSVVKSHTYMRNSGALGVALCCCLDASSPTNLGTYPPTAIQIEQMARIVAVACQELGIPCDNAHVMTHAECAVADGYPSERWDGSVWTQGAAPMTGGDFIRGKAVWYMQNGINA